MGRWLLTRKDSYNKKKNRYKKTTTRWEDDFREEGTGQGA